MGMMIDGQWESDDGIWAAKDGSFKRAESQFRCAIGDSSHPAEAGRYHLYVSLACPWAHRTLIFRKLKGLEDIIPVSIVHPYMLADGWEFRPDPEPLYEFTHAHQLYSKADARYSGRVSVPILWDKEMETVVNNESAEIIRIFNSAFNGLSGNTDDYYPEALRADIDAINAFVYPNINNGVYRCGFATTQVAYEEAFDALFAALDELESRLSQSRYLVGNQMTEADVRLYTTLVRFDAVYVGHFKCNRKRIADMPNLWAYLRDLYQQPAFGDTTDFDHIKQHYYYSHESINPTRIVAKGPELDFNLAHKRASFSPEKEEK